MVYYARDYTLKMCQFLWICEILRLISAWLKTHSYRRRTAVDITHFLSKTKYPQIALHAGKKWRHNFGISPLYLPATYHTSFQLNWFSVKYRFPFPILHFLP